MKNKTIENFEAQLIDQEILWGDYKPSEKELTIFEYLPEVQGWRFKDDVEIKKVAVHDGDFHSDDVFCITLLKELFPGLEVIRTRNPKLLADCDLCIDVGEGLLDHHGVRATDYVSAASRLFWAIINNQYAPGDPIEMPPFDVLYSTSKMWELVKSVAAWDTGHAEGQNPFPIVHQLCRHAVVAGKDMDKAFNTAVEKVSEIMNLLCDTAEIEGSLIETVEAQISEQADKEIIVFAGSESKKVPVKEMIYEKAKKAVFFISKEKDNDWRILCCCDPDQEYSFFGSRKLLSEKFRGLRGDLLSAASGIPGGIFCHAAGFIAGFETKEAAVKFAELNL